MAHILAKDLRDAVLQAALEGKLTNQSLKDTSVFDTLNKLKATKEKLVNDGKIYKKKPTEPFFRGDYPISIPDNWNWVQLSDVSIIQEGAGVLKNQYSKEGIQLFCVTNILDGSIDLKKKQLFVSKDLYETKFKHLTLNYGDIVTACSGGSWGKLSFYKEEEIVMLNTSTLRMRFFNDLANNDFLYYVCKSKFFKDQLKSQLVGIQPNFGYAHYSRICIPFPPIEEQQRIVERVKELMAKIDEYEKTENKLVELKKEFPGDMRDAILQAAIEGKLSKQFEDEVVNLKEDYFENDKELLNIPNNWKWLKLKNVADIRTGLSFKKTDQLTSEKGTLRILRGGNINDSFEYKIYDNDVYVDIEQFKTKYIPLKKGDVITPAVTSMEKMGKTGYIDKNMDDVTAGGFVYIMRGFENDINSRYLMYFIGSPFHKTMCAPNIHKSGQAFYNLKKSGLIEQPIPLPPIEEQQRIVEILDKLLPLCDGLV